MNRLLSIEVGKPKLLLLSMMVLLALVAQSASRPSVEELPELPEGDGALHPDVDNVEFHHVKVIDGVVQEGHPVVMYKEDFVGEDYKPTQNETKTNSVHKKYRHIQRRHRRPVSSVEKLKLIEPSEKIYFDVLPEKPIVSSNADDNDDGAIRFEAAELVKPSKEEWLAKYPKKYHSRHSRQRRNAYYRRSPVASYYDKSEPPPPQQALYYLPPVKTQTFQRYPVQGKRPSTGAAPNVGPRIGDENDNGDSDAGLDLLHSSNPDEADYSMFENHNKQNGGGGGASNNGASNTNNNGASGGSLWWQNEISTQPPIWSSSSGRRPLTSENPVERERPATPPVFSPPEPVFKTEKEPDLRYPDEPNYQYGTACYRATHSCCSHTKLDSMYDCFQRQGCMHTISDILQACT